MSQKFYPGDAVEVMLPARYPGSGPFMGTVLEVFPGEYRNIPTGPYGPRSMDIVRIKLNLSGRDHTYALWADWVNNLTYHETELSSEDYEEIIEAQEIYEKVR